MAKKKSNTSRYVGGEGVKITPPPAKAEKKKGKKSK